MIVPAKYLCLFFASYSTQLFLYKVLLIDLGHPSKHVETMINVGQTSATLVLTLKHHSFNMPCLMGCLSSYWSFSRLACHHTVDPHWRHPRSILWWMRQISVGRLWDWSGKFTFPLAWRSPTAHAQRDTSVRLEYAIKNLTSEQQYLFIYLLNLHWWSQVTVYINSTWNVAYTSKTDKCNINILEYNYFVSCIFTANKTIKKSNVIFLKQLISIIVIRHT